MLQYPQMPELDRTTEQEKIDGMRFIRLGDKIFYTEGQYDDHKQMAIEHGAKEKDFMGNPLVDDAGYFGILEGKLAFFRFTVSATIKGERGEARDKTVEITKKILGADKVY